MCKGRRELNSFGFEAERDNTIFATLFFFGGVKIQF